MSLRGEIAEQPEVAERLLRTQRDHVAEIAAALESRPIDGVMIAARGSSDHAAIYAQYVFGALHRLPVALAAPSLVTVYETPPRMQNWLAIGISQSGRAPDVVGVIEAARSQGAPTLAITNDPASELAQMADHAIDLSAGPERAVAATKTYTSELLVLAMLASAMTSTETDAPAWAGSRHSRLAALDAVPAALGAALDAEADAERAAHDRAHVEQCVVLGRGFEYATAREWALKLKELCQMGADPYSAADFQHGPLSLVEPGYHVLAIATSGRTAAGVVALLRRLRDDHGVDLLVISDDAETRALGTASLAVPAGLPEWLAPIASIVPAQLFAYHITRAKGLDPEHPRWISKVTLTH